MDQIKLYKDKIYGTFLDIYDKTLGKIFNSLFKKPFSLLFLGIDNSGKTTLFSKLKNNSNHIYLPTKHTVKETIEIGNLKATAFDLGGHNAARIAWKDYFYNVDGILFIIDVNDNERYYEVLEAFNTVVTLERKAPILVVMNKIDLIGETVQSINRNTKDAIEKSIGLDQNRENMKVIYLSILSENIYDEESELRKGFFWLSERVEKMRKENK